MKLSRTKAVEIIKNSNGKELIITFIKKNGDRRIIKGIVNPDEFMTNLGYIRFIEEKISHRLINPKTIEKVEAASESIINNNQ